jgi:hypothetical protein
MHACCYDSEALSTAHLASIYTILCCLDHCNYCTSGTHYRYCYTLLLVCVRCTALHCTCCRNRGVASCGGMPSVKGGTLGIRYGESLLSRCTLLLAEKQWSAAKCAAQSLAHWCSSAGHTLAQVRTVLCVYIVRSTCFSAVCVFMTALQVCHDVAVTVLAVTTLL